MSTGGADLPPLLRWPRVSVVIPARNAEGSLRPAVRSALEQRFDGSLEIVLGVAESEDDTQRIAGELSHDHANVRYVHNLDGSTPAGLNAAIAAARGDVIVRLDAHAELPPGYIARAVELLRETGAGNVGGMQVPEGRTPFGRAVAAAMSSRLGAGDARYRVGGDPGDVETVYLGVFRPEALEAVGGFDESLVRNQDYELNHRLREAGFRVYFHPDLAVTYQPRETPAALWRQYFDYGTWKRHVILTRPGSIKPRQLAAPVLVLGVAAALLVGILAGLWAPLLVLVGAYGLALLIGAAAAVEEASLIPSTVGALSLMHGAWGLGFLVGRRGPRGRGGTRRGEPGGRAAP